MSFEIPGFKPSGIIAAANLTAAQYRFLGRNRQLCATGVMPLGVIQNKPNTGEAVELMVDGVSKVICDGTVGINVAVAVGASGGVKAAATGNIIVGTSLEAGVVNQLIPVLLTPGGAASA